MASFDLSQYETVEERLRRLYTDHPEARVITKNLTTKEDRQVSTWVVRAELWLPITSFPSMNEKVAKADIWGNLKDNWLLKATGLAFEIDGVGMANKTSALENAETSAIGRCLANAGYSGSKRASRTEMEKVARAEQTDWLAEMVSIMDADRLRKHWQKARAGGASEDVLKQIEARGNELSKPADSAGKGKGN